MSLLNQINEIDGVNSGMHSLREEGDINKPKKKINWKKLNINNPSIPPLPSYSQRQSSDNSMVNKSVDYLKDLRNKREQDERDGVGRSHRNGDFLLDKYLNDPTLSEVERLEIVKRRAEVME